jgi:formylglycine-generating enzyme required for sulfatase activity
MAEIYTNPPVPTGYSYVSGQWNTGFIISRDSDKSEFVWIPVGSLKADCKLGKNTQSFGTRDYGYSGVTNDNVNTELSQQDKSVTKYGGFYISRYCMSKDTSGAIHSAKGVLPLTNINKFDSELSARAFENSNGVTSHLPYAAEIDSIISWLIDNGFKTKEDIAAAANTRNIRTHQDTVTETGSDDSRYALGIYDFAGTVDEWSFDLADGAFAWGCNPCAWPGSSRCYFAPYACYSYTGFRVALTIE